MYIRAPAMYLRATGSVIGMTLVACTCPHCGGEVKMEDSMISGYCIHCGRQIINDKAVVGRVDVRMDRSSELVNTLKLVKYSMYDGDADVARSLLSRAMQMGSDNSDVWYMDAVLDRRNAARDIERAKQFESLGVFSESEVEVYRNFDGTKGQTFLMMSIMVGFFTFFIMMVFGMIFEKYMLVAAGILIGIVLPASAAVYCRIHKPNIPVPTFDRDEATIRESLGLDSRRR